MALFHHQGAGSHAPGPQPQAPKPRTWREEWRRFVRLSRWALGISATSVLLLGLALIMTTIAVPNPMTHRKSERAPVIRVLANDGTVLYERGVAYDYMPIDLLPKHVIDAVVATEDRRFFEHWGVDPLGFLRAILTNLRAGRYAQGGSTLTQQLAKNLFLSSERRIGRKLQELYLALWLEIRLPKKDILELYLNRVYFGGGAYGIEAASRRYFNKSARELTVIEAAVLGGVLKAPSKFSPLSSPPLARARARVVVQKMLAAGYLDEEQAKHAANEIIAFHNPSAGRELTGYESVVDYVLERLPPLSNVTADQIIVETTIDANLQKRAQERLTSLIAAEGTASQVSQGALVMLEPDGAIRALVGGRNYTESQFNRATRAKRQPGSSFKPFVYLAALERGLTPDSVVYDLPLSLKGWSPRNENGTYRGAMTLRQALTQSINTVAVRLHIDAGNRRTIEAANRLGIKSELRDEPSLALGTSEVTLLELTNAYAAFASGGYAVEPHVIERVRTGHGVVLYQWPVRVPIRVVAERNVAQMNDMLNSALVNGTGRRATLANYQAAGKTGTSQDFRDAWFVGYTSDLVGGVWFGNDNGQAMNRIMGGSLPARLWHDVMVIAHQGHEPQPLPGAAPLAAMATTASGSQPSPPQRSAPAVASAPASRLPTERIDDDFVARALAGATGNPAPNRLPVAGDIPMRR